MVSDYPVYEKRKIDNDSLEEVNNLLEFVSKIRTFKQENQIPKDYQININAKEKDLIVKMLKCQDNLVEDSLKGKIITVKDLKAIICYEKNVNN